MTGLTPASIYKLSWAHLEETKEALQESEVKYKALFELSPEAIFIIDLDGTIIDCNDAGLRIENETREYIIGKSFTKLGTFEENEISKFMGLFSRLIEGEEVNPIEIELTRENDSKLWLEIIPGLLKIENEIYAIQIIARDISERKRAEDELSIKDNAIESSLNAIVISNLDGEITYVNPSFLEIWNCSDDSQIIGRPVVDFWDMGENALKVMQSLREQRNWFGELKAENIEGEQFDIQISMSMISDKGNIPIGIMASIIDITERKNMEEKIIKKLEREKKISQISTRFLNAKDLNNVIKNSLGEVGILAEASHGFLYLFDKEFKIKNESQEWYAEGVKSSLKQTEEVPSTSFTWLKNELKKGEIVYIPDVSKLPNEQQNEKKLLEERDVKSAITLPIIVRSKLVGFLGFDSIYKTSNWNEEDKTFLKLFAEILGNAFERKKSDENLKNAFEDIEKSISYLNATLESTDDGILVVDLDGIVKIFNRNFVELWEVPGSLMSTWNNEKIMEFLQDQLKEPVDLLNTKENLKDNLTQESYKMIETTKNKIFECYSKPQLIRDEIIGRVWSFRDITVRKRAEDELKQLNEELENRVKERTIELEKTYEKLRETQEQFYQAQKMDSIGILAGGIAHDFNNVLTGILGNISLIKISLKNDEYLLKLLTESEHGCVRAKDLTQQLLTFSKGGAPIKKTSSIADLIQETATFISSGLKVKCNFSIPANILPVEIDEGQISQVINNLIINADQAMPNGGIIDIIVENIIITKESAQEEDPGTQLENGKYVKLLVKDSGIGIPETHLHKIFEPYFSTKEKGSGLGLATAYSIIRNHDGHIKVNSELGKGTSFTLYLPASEKPLPKKEVNANLNNIDHEKRKILVLDDEEIILELVSEILSRSGYETIFAKDGAEAIELYQEAKSSNKPFDAVIMDLTIPGGMGGKEAIQRLREFDPEIKAIVSSGYSNDPIMADPKKYGFIGVIAKPYRIEELSKIVKNIVNNEI